MNHLRALALTVVGLAVLVLLIPAQPLTGDGAAYVEFVKNGLQHGASSWHERRLMGPAIVSVLPVEPVQGFLILTLASLGVTAMLLWLATRSLLAIPLFLGTWAVAPNLREYALIDPLAWAFFAGVWLCLTRRKWALAAVVAAVGVFAKEVVLLAAIAAAVAAWQPRKPWQAVLVALPALVCVVALTLVFPGSGSDAGGYLFKWVQDGLGSLGPLRVVYLIFASYGALWLLIPQGFRKISKEEQRAGAVLLLAAPLLPFVGSPERMEEAIFPIVVTCAVAATADWPRPLAWLLAIANCLFVARVGGDARLPTLVAWASLAVACGLAALSYARAWLPFPRSGLPPRPGQQSAAAPPPP